MDLLKQSWHHGFKKTVLFERQYNSNLVTHDAIDGLIFRVT